MNMPGRKFDAGSGYRYGFNGQEKSDEIGKGFNTALFWEYDSRIGRRWNLDPKQNAGISSYSTFANNPIFYNDPLGDTTVPSAGGTHSVEIDETQNSLAFYQPDATYTCNGKEVPVQAGQLRSFKNPIGIFKARWDLDANGNNVFAGYLNDRNQTVEAAVEEYNDFMNSYKGKFLLWSQGQVDAIEENPTKYNLKLSFTLLTMTAMAAAEPVPFSPSYNPSVTTQGSMSALGTLRFVTNVEKPLLTLAPYWPANGGALGQWTKVMALEGQVIDRYGSIYGTYASPVGTPFAMRALPPSTNVADYFQFQVLKPFSMESSLTTPWFGKIGLGIQYRLPSSPAVLEQLGYIKILKK